MSEFRGLISRFLPWTLIVLGAVLAILGVAARTVWAPDPFWTASLKPSADERLVVSDPGMLDLLAGQVAVSATVVDADDLTPEPEEDEPEPEEDEPEAEDEDANEDADEDEGPGVVISIARDVDATGWIDGSQALRLTGLQEESVLKASQVEGELESAATVNSDLWHHVASGTDNAELNWTQEPGRWSVVIASSPTKKISEISFTWPQSTATPMAAPLILIGAVLILAGAALLVFPQVLDRDARERALKSLREKTRSSKEAMAPTSEEIAVATATDTDTASDTVEPDLEEVPELDDVPEVEEDDDEPALEVEETAQPAHRFAPGTMTRRQIRKLERARQEAARAEQSPAANSSDAQPHTPEHTSDEVEAGAHGDSSDQEANAAEQESPTLRSEQWRKTWGFIPEESDEARTTGWLPKSVEDEEGQDE